MKLNISSKNATLKINPNLVTQLVYPKTRHAKKTGLLNHASLDPQNGIIYRNTKLFHTFGMHFPIVVITFDKNQQPITPPTVIVENRLFIVPLNAFYTIEISTNTLADCQISYQEIEKSRCIYSKKREIKIKAGLMAKTYYFILSKFILIFILLLSITWTHSIFAYELIQMKIGRTKSINLEKSPQSIQISDPEIIDIERIGISNSVKITPKTNGNAKVTILFDGGESLNWEVAVDQNSIEQKSFKEHKNSLIDYEKIYENLMEDGSEYPLSLGMPIASTKHTIKELNKIKNIRSEATNGKIAILGSIETLENFKKIARITGANPTNFQPLFSIKKNIESEVIHYVNQVLVLLGEKNLNLNASHNLYTLNGIPSSLEGKTRAWNFINSIVPNLINATSLTLGQSSIIQINLDFLEVSKSDGTQLEFPGKGLNSLSATLSFEKSMFPDGAQSPMLQIMPLNFLFKALQKKEFIRELAKPVIMSRSGEAASFLAGGEVPIESSVSNGFSTSSSTIYKPFGILFNVTPYLQTDGTIWVKLNIEVSQIAEQLSYNKNPGFTSRKVNTNIVLKEGNTAILSGLVHNKDLNQNERMPIIGNIPILGELFKSRNFRERETELWVAVTAVQNLKSSINADDEFFMNKKYHDYKNIMKPGLLD